jgi:3'-phosphoadenosine 5'-phosphosulfate sulfotransferase
MFVVFSEEKESSETRILVGAAGGNQDRSGYEAATLLRERYELLAIFTSIEKTAKANLRKSKPKVNNLHPKSVEIVVSKSEIRNSKLPSSCVA